MRDSVWAERLSLPLGNQKVSVQAATTPNITYNATAYNAANQATRTLIHAVKVKTLSQSQQLSLL